MQWVHFPRGKHIGVVESRQKYMEEAEYCNRLALIFCDSIVALGTPSELKQSAMKGELLLVECAPLGSALEILQSAPGVMDASVFGNALHLTVQDAERSALHLKGNLAERGVTVSRIEEIRPSLEDVRSEERRVGKECRS